MTRPVDRLLWPVIFLATALFLGWGLAPGWGLYTSLLPPARLLAIASVVKLAFLLAGALWAWACRGALEVDHPVRPAWALLALGIGATFAGQLILAPYQIGQGRTPFPTVADVFYLAAYPLLAAAFVRFAVAYGRAGFPVGTPREQGTVAGAVALIGIVVAVLVLRPILASQMAPLEKGLSVAYPALDLALLVPLALLLRITLRLRGGDLGTAWMIMLAGFALLSVADALFAYFAVLGEEGLDPYVHAGYVLSYGVIAGGVRRHRRILAP